MQDKEASQMTCLGLILGRVAVGKTIHRTLTLGGVGLTTRDLDPSSRQSKQ